MLPPMTIVPPKPASPSERLTLDPKSPTRTASTSANSNCKPRLRKAAQHLKGAMEFAPMTPPRVYAGQALQKSGESRGRCDALENSLKLLPDNFPARLLLVQVYIALKDSIGARTTGSRSPPAAGSVEAGCPWQPRRSLMNNFATQQPQPKLSSKFAIEECRVWLGPQRVVPLLFCPA